MTGDSLVSVHADIVELGAAFDAGVAELAAGFDERRELLLEANELLDRLIARLPEPLAADKR